MATSFKKHSIKPVFHTFFSFLKNSFCEFLKKQRTIFLLRA